MDQNDAAVMTYFAYAAAMLLALPYFAQLPCFAQARQQDPNLKNFYMSRQQIEIIDESPIVKRRAGAPGEGQAGMPAAPGELPQAGFNPYSNNLPSGPRDLPKVVNGIPPKTTPPLQNKATAAKLHAHAPSAKPAHPAPQTIKTYGTTYQRTPAATGAGYNSSARVQGTLLPWASKRRRSY